ncbi:MAG: C39 family peptidase [Parachlamydiaceae bacterium]
MTSTPTKTYHSDTPLWEESKTIPFDEMIISWNTLRPQQGSFEIMVSVNVDGWTPWYSYASWGCHTQQGGNASPKDVPLKIQQDIISILNGNKASGFRIEIRALEGANLEDFYSVHACVSRIAELQMENTPLLRSIDLNVPLVSQMALPHPRCRDMCSPTSTSAVVSYLTNNWVDPIVFAARARDEAFDIFGNWVLNTAEASGILGPNWCCSVQRLQKFDEIYQQLELGIPVIVSVKGPLLGSILPYNQGHLIVVKGYKAETNQVICMDPAFPCDEETNVSYYLTDFMHAWSRRQGVAYMLANKVNM